MQLLHDVCLGTLITDYLFLKPNLKGFVFNWNNIINRGFNLSTNYNDNDAAILLQLSLMVTNSNSEEKKLNTPNSMEDYPIFYDHCPMDLISKGFSNSKHNEPSNLAHVFYDKITNTIIIVFSGTNNLCLAGTDLDYSQVELQNITNYVPGIKGHQGMYSAYKIIRNKIIDIIKPALLSNNPPKLIITGHSLGGALSAICALDLAYYKPIHYSFGAPLFFNPLGAEAFEKYVTNSYRIANLSDIVTLLPLPVMPNGNIFCHVGKSVMFQRNLGTATNNHSAAYIIQYNIPVQYTNK